MITTIEYTEVHRMGRVDRYPVDDEIKEVIKMITGNYSPAISDRCLEGLERLGIQLVKVAEQKNNKG